MWTWSEQLICGRDNECVIGNVPNGDTNTMAVRGRERDPLPPSTIIKCDHRVVFTYNWPSVVAIATDTLHTYHYHQPVCSSILLSLTTLHRSIIKRDESVHYQPLPEVYWAHRSLMIMSTYAVCLSLYIAPTDGSQFSITVPSGKHYSMMAIIFDNGGRWQRISLPSSHSHCVRWSL